MLGEVFSQAWAHVPWVVWLRLGPSVVAAQQLPSACALYDVDLYLAVHELHVHSLGGGALPYEGALHRRALHWEEKPVAGWNIAWFHRETFLCWGVPWVDWRDRELQKQHRDGWIGCPRGQSCLNPPRHPRRSRRGWTWCS